jgi:predicted RecA/RadA family phage recombinase
MGRKVSDGKSVKVTVPESTVVEQGKFYLLDGFLGMAVQSVTTGAGETAQVVLNIENGEYETSQVAAADTLAAGTKVYWDNTNKVFTQVATGNRFAGVVTVGKDANNVRWFWFAPQQPTMTQAAAVANVVSADADATYDANEVTLINEIKTQFNDLLAKLRAAGVIAS